MLRIVGTGASPSKTYEQLANNVPISKPELVDLKSCSELSSLWRMQRLGLSCPSNQSAIVKDNVSVSPNDWPTSPGSKEEHWNFQQGMLVGQPVAKSMHVESSSFPDPAPSVGNAASNIDQAADVPPGNK